jgi:hypothetical protein
MEIFCSVSISEITFRAAVYNFYSEFFNAAERQTDHETVPSVSFCCKVHYDDMRSSCFEQRLNDWAPF